jgi:hypothetical protein
MRMATVSTTAREAQIMVVKPINSFILVIFYMPHMEYEGSNGLVMRKMKIFFR